MVDRDMIKSILAAGMCESWNENCEECMVYFSNNYCPILLVPGSERGNVCERMYERLKQNNNVPYNLFLAEEEFMELFENEN